jgi:DNA-binding transcriptional LysR family regulator
MLIAPRFGSFLRAHPEVTLDLVVDDGISDIVAGRFDAGIRIGERLDKDMIAIRLTRDLQLHAVASPDYLARHGTPQAPADLHHHSCIRWRNPGGTIYRWEFEKDGKSMEMNVEGPLVSTDLQLILDATLEGLGIAYTYDIRLDDWISEGRLIRVLADWSPQFPGLFLYYPSRRHPQPALRAFIDCLLDRA